MDSAIFGRLVHYLNVAIALAVLMEFSFLAALLGTLGAYNGGQPTTTPFYAQAYFVIGLLVTPVVIIRTLQMRTAARNQDLAGLVALHVDRWSVIGFVFSGFLPGVYLRAVATLLRMEASS